MKMDGSSILNDTLSCRYSISGICLLKEKAYFCDQVELLSLI